MNRKAGRKRRRKETDGQDSCWLTYVILTGLPLKAVGTLASATYVAMVHTGCSILTRVLLTWVTKLDATASTVHIMSLHTLCYLPIGTALQQTHEHKHISAVDSPLNEVCGVQCWINHLFRLFLPPHLQSSQHEATSLKVKLWCTNFGWMTSSQGQQETPSSSNNTKDVIWQFYHHLLVTSSWGIRRRRKSLIQISHPWSWIFDLLIHLLLLFFWGGHEESISMFFGNEESVSMVSAPFLCRGYMAHHCNRSHLWQTVIVLSVFLPDFPVPMCQIFWVDSTFLAPPPPTGEENDLVSIVLGHSTSSATINRNMADQHYFVLTKITWSSNPHPQYPHSHVRLYQMASSPYSSEHHWT